MDINGPMSQVPPNLNKTQKLSFNITLLFPQPKNSTTLNITSFATMLPTFNQVYGKLSPSVRFQQAALGGPMSTVTADVRESVSLCSCFWSL